jgi:dTMP kinase
LSAWSGVLITLEGGDGCGKSTQARLLCDRLSAAGLPVGPTDAAGTVVREPGGTPVGEAIRDLLLHGPHAPDPWTETLLYAAARAELVARILLPELSRGRVLVLDRFVDSSLAYQGCARGLGLDEVLAVNRPGLRGVLPDLTLILDMDPVESMRRVGGEHDRMEAEGLGFQQDVRAGFAAVARRFPERVRVIDGGRDIDTVARDVAAAARATLADVGLGGV